jgi:quinolinate synthase
VILAHNNQPPEIQDVADYTSDSLAPRRIAADCEASTMLHQLGKANPLVLFEPVNRAAVCRYMQMITPAKLLRSPRDGADVAPDVAGRARRSVERMIAIGQSGGAE